MASEAKDCLRKRWMRILEVTEERVLKMPEWMVKIFLEDVETAVRNRIAIFERVQDANGRS